MKIEFSTASLPLIVPDTYGTEFQCIIAEDMWEDFKRLMIDKAKEAIEYALQDTDFAKAKVTMGGFHSPQYYNYITDWIDFDLEFDDGILDKIKLTDDFYSYIKKNFSSYDGYFSFCPVEREEFDRAIKGEGRQDLAVAMIILYQFEKENNLQDYQQAYLDDVLEYASENGYEDYDEEVSE